MISERHAPLGLALVFAFTVFLLALFTVHNNAFREVSAITAKEEFRFLKNDILEHVRNSTLGFQEILVLNLPKRTDRKDAMILAAVHTNIKPKWIDGVDGNDVLDLTLPLRPHQSPPSRASKGSWRAHLNALRSVVENDISSVLILEDDLDWDIHLKDQLFNFSLACRTLIQPLLPGPHDNETQIVPLYIEQTYPPPRTDQHNYGLPLEARYPTIPPHTSPYGDTWDVLWLGHCGMLMPSAFTPGHSSMRIRYTDTTVPARSNLDTNRSGSELIDAYPDHTRVVHHAFIPVCSLAYAVSQRGARRILYELSVRNYTSEYDNMLRELCDGEEMREGKLVCLTAQPAYFSHWRERGWRGKDSDIDVVGDDDEWREEGRSVNIRWSVRRNMGVFHEGEAVAWVDQWPD
ncbi:hypothetical protein BDV96DRAFT_645684 [Lophiotrema nucula]|uniref:Glycosyltransferase family 25 protein n=1 Tax=Lophiotrema nucula TaxID=690887 RepID=A0A6A5ZC93_9PLEO|nr:hypothetical protein BDV96DRAFT_645684 [Lophiotrema nucula]